MSETSYTRDPAFCVAIALVLTSEGGFVNDPGDPGGPTKFGIAWNYNATTLQKLGITRDTVNTLTLDQARQVYYQKYWLGSGAAGISDEGLAYVHLDTAVNCGSAKAQQLLRRLSVDPKNFNGKGDNNEALFLRLVMEYELLRLDFYTHTRADLKKRYLEGWANRMVFCGQQALKLV